MFIVSTLLSTLTAAGCSLNDSIVLINMFHDGSQVKIVLLHLAIQHFSFLSYPYVKHTDTEDVPVKCHTGYVREIACPE